MESKKGHGANGIPEGDRTTSEIKPSSTIGRVFMVSTPNELLFFRISLSDERILQISASV